MKKNKLVTLLTLIIIGLSGYFIKEETLDVSSFFDGVTTESVTEVPGDFKYDGQHQDVPINQNQPTFSSEDLSLKKDVWQTFSDLDSLNRVGQANALIGKKSFPTTEREPLTVKPTGWKQKKLAGGQYLYNRCHLVGHQLTGENNNPKNLMTGTRSFNTPFMLTYENQIKDHIQQTGEHVRYRVTPYFHEKELVARGIQLEAQSVESTELSFNVFIFNVQEGYDIDYETGQSRKS